MAALDPRIGSCAPQAARSVAKLSEKCYCFVLLGGRPLCFLSGLVAYAAHHFGGRWFAVRVFNDLRSIRAKTAHFWALLVARCLCIGAQ